MEAIYEFEVKDMPVTVAVDTNGESVHITGPAVWQKKSPKAWRSRSSKPAPSLEKPGPAPGAATGRSLDWQRRGAVQPNQKYSKVRFAAEIRPNNDQASALTQRGLTNSPSGSGRC